MRAADRAWAVALICMWLLMACCPRDAQEAPAPLAATESSNTDRGGHEIRMVGWEPLEYPPTLNQYARPYRARTPDGWLVVTGTYGESCTVQVTYVPDPQHAWLALAPEHP